MVSRDKLKVGMKIRCVEAPPTLNASYPIRDGRFIVARLHRDEVYVTWPDGSPVSFTYFTVSELKYFQLGWNEKKRNLPKWW
jgi:hypothetical protein